MLRENLLVALTLVVLILATLMVVTEAQDLMSCTQVEKRLGDC